jgi:hypothetical protein
VTLIELALFLLICLAVGFSAHLVFPTWGWWIGAVPAFVLMLVMAFFTFWNLFSSEHEKRAKHSKQ